MTRVFLAGAAGVIGRLLVPMLIDAGHEVAGTTRSPDRARWLRDAGARPVIVDVIDAAALREAVAAARPEIVVHQLTDLVAGFGREQLAANARLRQIGTRNLIDAAVAAGARRLVAQSGAWVYADGPAPHSEDDPLRDPSAFPDDVGLRGIVELERLATGTRGLDGVVLRYGFFHGPGAQSADPAAPPTVHVVDAARAAALAVQGGRPGVYNIVDDGDPVADNARAREELRWRPTYRRRD